MESKSRPAYTLGQGGVVYPRPQVRCVFRRDYGSLTFDIPPSQTTRWRAVARVLRSPMDALGCALLPAPCSLCGCPLPHLSSVPICSACWLEIHATSGLVCAQCGDSLDAPPPQSQPQSTPVTAPLCRTCRLAPPPFQRAVSFGPYHGRMKDAIHALKYDRMRRADRPLGQLLAHAIAQLASEAPAELLVIPVPLHRSKYADRGFNQARAIAAQALQFLAESHPAWRLTLASSTLLRQRATETQAGLTPHQRRINVRGAFRVSAPAAVAGQHILLIDDILTTGATARAAAQALLDAGAESVWVATLARARRLTADRQTFSEELTDAANLRDLSGNPVNANQRPESMHSSSSQPSF